MTKTKIEWCDYTINPVKGLCPAGCEYCYARRMYQRFGWNPEIREAPYWVDEIPKRGGHRIFMGSTMELFGPWVKEFWLNAILYHCGKHREHTFLFLTKRPWNLVKWSPFPENCWVGVTATDTLRFADAHNWLHKVDAKVKFISVEPLRDWDGGIFDAIKFALSDRPVDWIIIGQQTPVRKATMPKVEWIREIVHAADQAGVPVFLKDNLRPLLWAPLTGQAALDTGLLNWAGELRQEFPE